MQAMQTPQAAPAEAVHASGSSRRASRRAGAKARTKAGEKAKTTAGSKAHMLELSNQTQCFLPPKKLLVSLVVLLCWRRW